MELLNHCVYSLCDQGYKALPQLLAKDYKIKVTSRLKRRFVIDNAGKHVKVNIIGEAIKARQRVTIVGDCKLRLSKADIYKFLRRKINRLNPTYKNIFPILVTHMITEPDTDEYAKKKGVALYYSYDF